MGWANQTIDSTVASSEWVKTIKSALITFDNSGFGLYWNLVALTILIILLLAFRDTQRARHDAASNDLPHGEAEPHNLDNTLENTEEKERFRLFTQQVMRYACSRMQQMANQVHGTLFNAPVSTREERLLHYSVEAYLSFMKPLEDREKTILEFLAARESLSNDDFLFAQRLFVDLYNVYEQRRPWLRDMAWETFPNVSTYSVYTDWEKADHDMREKLSKLTCDCPVLGDNITDLTLPAPRRWEKGGS